MQTLLVLLLAVPSCAEERGTKPSGAVAARRAAAPPSAMAVRRAAAAHRAAGAGAAAPTSPPAAPAGAPQAVPAAAADPEFHPRITPPKGSPLAGVDLRRQQGVAYTAPAAPAPEAPLPAVGAEGAPGAGPERAPGGVKGAAVTELKAGRSDRQFGGATDPVLFLMGGTGPSGAVTSSSDGSSISVQLGGQQR